MTSPLKLKDININNLVDVRIALVPGASRGYGRHFTISLGNSSKEVVFKELFKKAQSLLRTVCSPKELSSFLQFVDLLVEKEKDANTEYNNQNCLYKFRTWFHRFFGGAYLGSHLDRLYKMQDMGADYNIQKTIYNLEYVFTTKDIGVGKCKTELQQDRPFPVVIRDNTFDVWASSNSVNIQEQALKGTQKGLLTIAISDDHSIEFEGKKVDEIPREFRHIFSSVAVDVARRVDVLGNK